MLLQAMRATLTQDPQFHMIRTLDGIEHPGSVVKMRLDAGFSGNEDPGEFILTAKDDQAHALMKYKRGDELEFVGNLCIRPGKTGITLSLVKIDESRTLVAATEKFLQGFTPPKVPLMEQIRNAEQQKAAAEAQGKQPAKEAIQ